MTEPLSPSGQSLLDQFKREQGIETEEFGAEMWMAYFKGMKSHPSYGSTEIQAVRKLCKQDELLCDL